MLPQLHKLQRLNEIIAQNPLEYIQISEILDIEGQPIKARSVEKKVMTFHHYEN